MTKHTTKTRIHTIQNVSSLGEKSGRRIISLAADPGINHVYLFAYTRSLTNPPPTFLRKCPGADMAYTQLFHEAAVILSVFDIRPEIDNKGNPILPKVEFEGDLVR